MTFLGSLRPLFDAGHEQDHAIADNACSAVARFILAAPHALPLAQVLPIFLAALPLKADLLENDTVYGSVAALLAAENPALAASLAASLAADPALLAQLLLAAAHGLAARPCADATKAALVRGLKAVAADPVLSATAAAAFAALPADAAALLQQALA